MKKVYNAINPFLFYGTSFIFVLLTIITIILFGYINICYILNIYVEEIFLIPFNVLLVAVFALQYLPLVKYNNKSTYEYIINKLTYALIIMVAIVILYAVIFSLVTPISVFTRTIHDTATDKFYIRYNGVTGIVLTEISKDDYILYAYLINIFEILVSLIIQLHLINAYICPKLLSGGTNENTTNS